MKTTRVYLSIYINVDSDLGDINVDPDLGILKSNLHFIKFLYLLAEYGGDKTFYKKNIIGGPQIIMI